MPNTSGGLPYPVATDPIAQGAAAIQALAVALETRPILHGVSTVVQNVPAWTNPTTGLPVSAFTVVGSITAGAAAGTIVIPGWYRVSAFMGGAAGGASPAIQITKNSAVADTGTIPGARNSLAGQFVACTAIVKLVAGDVIRPFVYGVASVPIGSLTFDVEYLRAGVA